MMQKSFGKTGNAFATWSQAAFGCINRCVKSIWVWICHTNTCQSQSQAAQRSKPYPVCVSNGSDWLYPNRLVDTKMYLRSWALLTACGRCSVLQMALTYTRTTVPWYLDLKLWLLIQLSHRPSCRRSFSRLFACVSTGTRAFVSRLMINSGPSCCPQCLAHELFCVVSCIFSNSRRQASLILTSARK